VATASRSLKRGSSVVPTAFIYGLSAVVIGVLTKIASACSSLPNRRGGDDFRRLGRSYRYQMEGL
jgi:hypothetical protein